VRAAAALAVVALIAGAVWAATAPPPSPKLISAGKKTYDVACAPCHGSDGDGKGPVSFAIKPPPRNFRKDAFKAGDTVEQIFATVTTGLPNTKMVGYPQISDEDRWGVAYYVLAFRPAK
jgi:mono/diheme cytochrome c family protein